MNIKYKKKTKIKNYCDKILFSNLVLIFYNDLLAI